MGGYGPLEQIKRSIQIAHYVYLGPEDNPHITFIFHKINHPGLYVFPLYHVTLSKATKAVPPTFKQT